MSLKIVLLLLSIISLKIPQKCKVQQSLSMQPWIESLHRQHHHELRKKLRRSSPISYYSNTSATHRILLGGDIKTNPSPTSTTNSGLTPTNNKKQQWNVKLQFVQFMKKTGRINPKQMICPYCKLLTHLHCTNTKILTISNTKNAKEWICFSCASIELRFHLHSMSFNSW